jgi:hypothetical protein
MLACAPGQSCCAECRSAAPGGLGEASPNVALSAPRTTQVLYDYAVSKLQKGEPFYITSDFNSEVLASDGMGFFAAIFSAAAAAATKIAAIAPKVAQVAGTVQAVKAATGGGGGGGSSGPTADDIAAAVTPAVKAQLQAQGVNLPADVAQQTVAASILDAFGPQNRPWVIAGIAGISLLLLLRLTGR